MHSPPASLSHRSAYEKGRDAFLAGKPRHACPYNQFAVAVVGKGRHVPIGEVARRVRAWIETRQRPASRLGERKRRIRDDLFRVRRNRPTARRGRKLRTSASPLSLL